MNYEEFFQKAKEKGLSNVQVTEKHTIDSSVEVINGKIESFDDYDNTDYSLKAEKEKKTIKVSANYFSEKLLDQILENMNNTDSIYEDEYLEKTENIKMRKPLEFDISKEIQILKEIEEIRKKYPQVVKTTSYFGENYSNTRIVNSNGVDISTDSHLCSFVVEAIVQVGEEFTSFSREVLKTNKKEINFLEFAEDVMKKAVLQSNREKCDTKKYNIILDSSVAGSILRHLINMTSALNIRDKVSCLNNKLEEKIFDDQLTIIEDPTNEEYPGYRLFDDEGTKTKKKTIVENGVLKTYLYNIKEAKLKNKKSTGNGYQGISTRNMIIVPKEKSLEELLKSMKDGLYIVDYMGASGTSINTVTGAISLQVFGFIARDGEIISGIEPSIMTTTIFELFSNIEEIGNDLTFTETSSASPSLWVKDISIAR